MYCLDTRMAQASRRGLFGVIAIPPGRRGLDFTFCLLYKSYIRFI